MIQIEETDMVYLGLDDLMKALRDGSLLRKFRNENRRLKREVARLRKENKHLKSNYR